MNILIIDDHIIFREGLRLILKTSGVIMNIVEAGNGNEALKKFIKGKYDLVILDISLPDISGLELLKQFRRTDDKARILILSMHPEEHFALRSIKSGAYGYLTKDASVEEILKSVNRILSGKKYISEKIAEQIALKIDFERMPMLHELLSDREFEIMLYIAKGTSLNDISQKLFISDKTVGTYRSRIMDKMNMQRNAELTLYCVKNELI